MECLKSTFDYRCNPPFVPEKTEQGPIPVAAEDELDVVDDTVYREFTPLDPENCAVNDDKKKCKEFEFVNKTNTKELRGTYGVYPSSGYVVDFDSDRALNKKKLETLELENWIDSDTRAIQVLWTIRSSWSQTLFTFQASLEWSGNGMISNQAGSNWNPAAN